MLKDYLHNKTIDYYPIVSMRDYVTNEYNLTCDGNVNRFISLFYTVSNAHVNIHLPKNITDDSIQFLKYHFKQIYELTNTKVDITYIDYGKNALETREKLSSMVDITLDNNPNIIIFEPNCLIYKLLKLKEVNQELKTVYWCPVSNTKNTKPEFLKPLALIDIDCVYHSDFTMVCTESQKQYFTEVINLIYDKIPKIEIHNKIIEPQFFDVDEANTELLEHIKTLGTKFVYLPFRLSDKGYRIQSIINSVRNIRNKFKQDIIILYTDPNSSGLLDNIDFCKKLEQHGRRDFYTVLKFANNTEYKVVIPYLEDVDEIVHASIFEMEHFECPIIKFASSYIFNTELTINSIEQLEQKLIEFFSLQ